MMWHMLLRINNQRLSGVIALPHEAELLLPTPTLTYFLPLLLQQAAKSINVLKCIKAYYFYFFFLITVITVPCYIS